jgi:hypothetical protein
MAVKVSNAYTQLKIYEIIQQFELCERYTPLVKTDVKALSKSLNYRVVSIYHQPMSASKNTLLR